MYQPHEHPMEESQRLLKVGIGLSIFIFLLEFFGGLWTGSLALMSDAWHLFIDIWALVLSFFAFFVARRPANDRRTFGLHRMEVFAAMINGLTVFGIALGILFAAWRRWHHPSPVASVPLLWISSVSFILNIGVARLFYKQSHRDMNIRGAYLHLLGDALNTLPVIGAALAMMWTGSYRIDPIVSAVTALIVLWGSGRLLKEAVNTLLEGVPRGIEVGTVEKEILAIPGVSSVHDLHVWSICSHLNALSGHVLLADEQMTHQHEILEKIGQSLKSRFGIIHTTIQVESKAWPTVVDMDEAQHG